MFPTLLRENRPSLMVVTWECYELELINNVFNPTIHFILNNYELGVMQRVQIDYFVSIQNVPNRYVPQF
jgi:hypothetical protein